MDTDLLDLSEYTTIEDDSDGDYLNAISSGLIIDDLIDTNDIDDEAHNQAQGD